ncbi:L-fucose mutarotase [Catellatospora sp. TT07R-123]|uniref:RbsD/FucU family protein n=1 Tax=Catellatospora sp. TT07R-123 TaxID=2733863 RepID=UPI001B143BA7|nr:RbsD/FucU family protein [Catellatospora sp. TT07R-123]GHJ43733.1 L-fucose mutarotase [Catellatospora sp. TT07R-123]
MLRTRLIHPPLLAALAGTGHGSRILLADANYAHDVNVRTGATVIHLNLRPGMVTVDEILGLIVEFVPLESVSTMRPDDGSTPDVWSRYADLLGPDLALNPIGRQDFYAAARAPELAVAVATGDERLYANLLLTVGYIAPPAH